MSLDRAPQDLWEPTRLNELGVHALVWAEEWTTAEAERAVELSAEAGFDLVEIPLIDRDALDLRRVRARLDSAGIGVRCSLGLGFDADVSSEDPAVAARGEEVLARAVEAASEVGSPLLTGVLYSALGKYPRPPTRRGWDSAVGALGRVADRAAALGVTLGLEVVNRYESNLVNTAATALRMVGEIGRSNVVVHLDSYHMNIEEGDFYGPVLACGRRLGYVHVGESHRGYLGSGLVDLPTLFRALVSVGYGGAVTFEAFSAPSRPTDLTTTLAAWRRLWEDPLELAKAARSHLAGLLAAAHQAARTPSGTDPLGPTSPQGGATSLQGGPGSAGPASA